MRQGSIAGAVFLWVFVALIASIAEERNALAVANATGVTQYTTLKILLNPKWSDVFMLEKYLGAVLNVITLWFNGTLWQGHWIWAYFLVILSIMMGIGWEILIAVASGIGTLLGVVSRTIGSLIGLER